MTPGELQASILILMLLVCCLGAAIITLCRWAYSLSEQFKEIKQAIDMRGPTIDSMLSGITTVFKAEFSAVTMKLAQVAKSSEDNDVMREARILAAIQMLDDRTAAIAKSDDQEFISIKREIESKAVTILNEQIAHRTAIEKSIVAGTQLLQEYFEPSVQTSVCEDCGGSGQITKEIDPPLVRAVRDSIRGKLEPKKKS